MATEWLATHAAGFGPLAERLAARDLPGASIRADGDNALRISGGIEPRAVLAYCRALFRVLGEETGGLAGAARRLAADPSFEARLGGALLARRGGGRGGFVDRSGGTFALRCFGPDDPEPIPPEARRAIELRIARATGMRPHSVRPSREYRLQERAEGPVLFLERMDAGRHAGDSPRGGDSLNPGELPRTTCRLLAEMTEPEPDDVFLDPFCGYGGIALERALAAPYRFVFASDRDADKVAAVKRELSAKAFEKRRRTFFPKVRDALESSAFEAGFVAAIATDPPWGLYEGGPAEREAAAILDSFLVEASRLLASGGRLVLLVAREAADRVSRGPLSTGLELVERLDVLVSGKKASVMRLNRR